jgi:hypothetical protein
MGSGILKDLRLYIIMPTYDEADNIVPLIMVRNHCGVILTFMQLYCGRQHLSGVPLSRKKLGDTMCSDDKIN